MGRFYNTAKAGAPIDFMSRLPEDLMIKAVQAADKGYTANRTLVEKLSLVDAETFPELNDRMQDLLGKIDMSVEEMAAKVNADPLGFRKFSPELNALAMDIERQFTKGEIGHYKDAWQQTQDWRKEMYKAHPTEGATIESTYQGIRNRAAAGEYDWAGGKGGSPDLPLLVKPINPRDTMLGVEKRFKETELAGLAFDANGNLTPGAAATWKASYVGGRLVALKNTATQKEYTKETLEQALRLAATDTALVASQNYKDTYMPEYMGYPLAGETPLGDPIYYTKGLKTTQDQSEALTRSELETERAIQESLLNLSGFTRMYDQKMQGLGSQGGPGATRPAQPVTTVTQFGGITRPGVITTDAYENDPTVSASTIVTKAITAAQGQMNDKVRIATDDVLAPVSVASRELLASASNVWGSAQEVEDDITNSMALGNFRPLRENLIEVLNTSTDPGLRGEATVMLDKITRAEVAYEYDKAMLEVMGNKAMVANATSDPRRWLDENDAYKTPQQYGDFPLYFKGFATKAEVDDARKRLNAKKFEDLPGELWFSDEIENQEFVVMELQGGKYVQSSKKTTIAKHRAEQHAKGDIVTPESLGISGAGILVPKISNQNLQPGSTSSGGGSIMSANQPNMSNYGFITSGNKLINVTTSNPEFSESIDGSGNFNIKYTINVGGVSGDVIIKNSDMDVLVGRTPISAVANSNPLYTKATHFYNTAVNESVTHSSAVPHPVINTTGFFPSTNGHVAVATENGVGSIRVFTTSGDGHGRWQSVSDKAGLKFVAALQATYMNNPDFFDPNSPNKAANQALYNDLARDAGILGSKVPEVIMFPGEYSNFKRTRPFY